MNTKHETTNNRKTFSTKLIYYYIRRVAFQLFRFYCHDNVRVRVCLYLQANRKWKMHCVKTTSSENKGNHNNMGGLKG